MYIMSGRPLTPHKTVGYKKVETELSSQINSIAKSKAKAEADKRLIERLYQIQLAERLNLPHVCIIITYEYLSLSQERENYLREKEKKKTKLNRTYNYQIKHRIPELPKYHPDNEVLI